MISISAATTASELQAVIHSAGAGETIKLEAGTFTFDRTVVIDRDDISVVGAGSGLTNIELTGAARAGGAFQVGGVIDQPTYLRNHWMDQSANEGAKTIHLGDATGLKAGDHLWVELPNTSAYLNEIGDFQWREVKPLRTTMVEVASVNGNSVHLVNALGFDFAPGTSVRLMDVTENVKLGGFSVDSGLYAAPDDFTNRVPGLDRANVISLSGTSHVTLTDIAIENAPSNGITASQSSFLTASGISVDGSVNKGDGGNGYAFQLRGVYDSKLTGLEAYDTRHAVVFASWTSEVNNTIQVTQTNRDINFHGGPDHGNVVDVLNSLRTEAEARYLSPTLFVNESGTSYGAPTDASANPVTFHNVTGTVRPDRLVASDRGAEFHAREGEDLLIGGAGNDQLFADKGNDTVRASAGLDRIDGGMGADVLIYAGDRGDYTLTRGVNGEFVIHKAGGDYDRVTGIETFQFKDGSVAANATNLPTTHFGTSGADSITITSSDDVVLGAKGFDRVYSAVSYALGEGNEALQLTGSAAVDGTGNALANAFTGNDAANRLSGLDGNDRFYGRGGNDTLLGGDGNDTLYGQNGNDRLSGGDGLDVLHGGSGADTFVFSTGRDVVTDFSLRGGDRLDVSGTSFGSAAAFLAAFGEAAHAGGDTLDLLGLDVEGSGQHVELRTHDAAGDVLAMSLEGVSVDGLLAGTGWLLS